jgi:uncharacterized protein
MASGLFALLDDIAAIAKVAAATIDDTAAQAVKASSTAAGIVIDDTAVTPRYVVGFPAERELPIIGRIAMGSLKNKLLFLLPGALLLSFFAPWAIVPLLMLGGLYLCWEGWEKLLEWFTPHGLHTPLEEAKELVDAVTAATDKSVEEERVAGAIRTDLILSAEVLAIALASVEQAPFVVKAMSLTVVAFLVTGLVYGLVAMIVKADDVGLAMVKRGGAGVGLGKLLVNGMPPLLKVLSVVGTLAMLWVGGGILIHGLHEMGVHGPEAFVKSTEHSVAQAMAGVLPWLEGFSGWLTAAVIAGVLGAVLGAIVDVVVRLARPGRPAH